MITHSNGARDLQIQNLFQEGIAGRQCKGRQPDFQHRRPLDIQLTLSGHYWRSNSQSGIKVENDIFQFKAAWFDG